MRVCVCVSGKKTLNDYLFAFNDCLFNRWGKYFAIYKLNLKTALNYSKHPKNKYILVLQNTFKGKKRSSPTPQKYPLQFDAPKLKRLICAGHHSAIPTLPTICKRERGVGNLHSKGIIGDPFGTLVTAVAPALMNANDTIRPAV